MSKNFDLFKQFLESYSEKLRMGIGNFKAGRLRVEKLKVKLILTFFHIQLLVLN